MNDNWIKFPTHTGYWFVYHPDLAKRELVPYRIEVFNSASCNRALIYDDPLRDHRTTVFDISGNKYKFHPVAIPSAPK